MTKRELTEKEKELTQKGIENLNTEYEYSEAILKQKKLAIEIAPVVYKKQVSDLQQEVKKMNGNLDNIKNLIDIYTKQISEGVEVKESTSEVSLEETEN